MPRQRYLLVLVRLVLDWAFPTWFHTISERLEKIYLLLVEWLSGCERT